MSVWSLVFLASFVPLRNVEALVRIVGCSASSSDMRYDGRCEYAFDDDPCGSNWVSTTVHGGGVGAPDWIQVEFGSVQTVDAVQLWQRGGMEMRGVRLEFSSGEPVDFDLPGERRFEGRFPERSTSFVRIVTTKNTGMGHNGFSNIEFWNVPAGTTSALGLGKLLPEIEIVGCSASSADMRYDGRCQYAYDADACTSNWVSTTVHGGGVGMPDWIEVNFGAVQKVNGVRLWQRGGKEMRGVRLEFDTGLPIEMAQNGTKYGLSYSGSTIGADDIMFFEERTTSRVRLVTTANTGMGHNGFSDIAFFHDTAVSGLGGLSRGDLSGTWELGRECGQDSHSACLPKYDEIGTGFNVKTGEQTHQPILALPVLSEKRQSRIWDGNKYFYPKGLTLRIQNSEVGSSSMRAFQSRDAWDANWAVDVGLEVKAVKMSGRGSIRNAGAVAQAFEHDKSVSRALKSVKLYELILLRPFPSLHPSVESRLRQLDALTSNESVAEFEAELKLVFDAFGTHFIRKIDVGGRIEQFVTTSRCAADKSLKTETEIEVEAERSFSPVFTVSGSARTKVGYGEATSASSGSSYDDFSAYGGDLQTLKTDGFEAWKQTIKWGDPASMAQIGFKLSPIWREVTSLPVLKSRMEEFYYSKYLARSPQEGASKSGDPTCDPVAMDVEIPVSRGGRASAYASYLLFALGIFILSF